MKTPAAAAALAFALATCGESPQPLGPSSTEPDPELGKAQTQYDAEAAAVVVADLLTRVLPTLTSGPALAALENHLEALASALSEADYAALSGRVDAAKQALEEYGAGAPEQEEPELEGVEFALDYVTEGLFPPPGGGKGGGRRA